jgi:hypothetical protein
MLILVLGNSDSNGDWLQDSWIGSKDELIRGFNRLRLYPTHGSMSAFDSIGSGSIRRMRKEPRSARACTWKIGGFNGGKHTPQSRASVSSTVTSPAAAAPSGCIRDGGSGGIAEWEDSEPLLVLWTPALARAAVAFFRTATMSSRRGNSRHWEGFAVVKPHHDTMARRRLCSVLWCQASKYFKNKKKFIRKKIKTEMNT